MSYTRITYQIAVFERHGERLVTTILLSAEEAIAIRRLLGYNDNEGLFDCYPVRDDTLRKVSDVLGERLTKGCYDYFFEATS